MCSCWGYVHMFKMCCLQVCDEPHPLLIKEMLSHCVEGRLDEAYVILKSLWDKGYSAHDIITNIFRVCKSHQMPEFLKLEYIKVGVASLPPLILMCVMFVGDRFFPHEDSRGGGIIAAAVWTAGKTVSESDTIRFY